MVDVLGSVGVQRIERKLRTDARAGRRGDLAPSAAGARRQRPRARHDAHPRRPNERARGRARSTGEDLGARHRASGVNPQPEQSNETLTSRNVNDHMACVNANGPARGVLEPEGRQGWRRGGRAAEPPPGPVAWRMTTASVHTMTRPEAAPEKSGSGLMLTLTNQRPFSPLRGPTVVARSGTDPARTMVDSPPDHGRLSALPPSAVAPPRGGLRPRGRAGTGKGRRAAG